MKGNQRFLTMLKGHKLNHPFVYMTLGLFIWCYLSTSSPPGSSTGSSTDQNLQLSNMARIDGTIPNLYADNNNVPKQYVYTFFQGTGPGDNIEKRIIEVWRHKWTEAGWNPVVLSMDHARRHARFQEFQDKLQHVSMPGSNEPGHDRAHGEFGFYRWLAMASMGGGWLCDYDIFPVGFGTGTAQRQSPELPNGGKFSIFSLLGDFEGAPYPGLMSGDAAEWERMAFTILQNALEKSKGDHHWTDFSALVDLRSTKYVFHWTDEVVPGQDALPPWPFGKDDCKTLVGKRGIHFGRIAMLKGNWRSFFPGADDGRNPVHYIPSVVTNWYETWNKECWTQ